MKRRIDTALGFGIFAVVLAGLFGVLAWRDGRRARGKPPAPYEIVALSSPPDVRASVAPDGARLNEQGRLTILDVPATSGVAEARAGQEAITDERPREARQVPNAMLAGIRALFTLGPEPLDQGDRLMTLEAPDPMLGRLLLVDGCFRFGSLDGPAAVFPFGTMLGLVDGRLVVGPPGLAAARSARVGEVIAWESWKARPISEEGKAKVQRFCHSNDVLAVVPASARVAETRYESDLAERWAGMKDLAFSAAIGPVRQCLKQVRRARRYAPGTPCELLIPPPPPAPPPAPPPPPQFR